MRLIKSEIDLLTCPPGKRDRLVFDDDLTGFALRITSSGGRVFLFQYRRGGLVRRLVLGRYGDITANEARRLAEVARGAVSAGRDPVGEYAAALAAEAALRAEQRRQAAAEVFTLEHLVKAWAETGLRGASESHTRDAPAAVRRCFARYLDRPASLMRPADAQAAVDALVKAHQAAGRHARDYARAMGNWAVGRELLATNPFAAVRVEAKPVTRERALSDPELGAVWRAASSMPYPFGPLLRLLILTMQRRSEVAGMRWDELAPDLSIWTLPANRSKNRKKHFIHLAEPARAVLRELAERTERTKAKPLVFTITGDTQVSGFSNAVGKLVKLMDAEGPPGAGGKVVWAGPWTLHDFRRTGVTTLARLGVAPHVADRMLNHVQGSIRGVAAVYQRHDFMAERESAARQWAAHVLAVAEAGRPVERAGNVVRLVAKRRK
jgi:integrase